VAFACPHDVALGISHTGVTRDTIDALAEARAHGATTIALTNFAQSPIARVANHMLTTAARETTFRCGAMASRLAQLTVVDCLFVGAAQRTYADTLAALEATREAVRARRGSLATPTRWRRAVLAARVRGAAGTTRPGGSWLPAARSTASCSPAASSAPAKARSAGSFGAGPVRRRGPSTPATRSGTGNLAARLDDGDLLTRNA